MIGLSFLAIGLLWLSLSWYLAKRLPTWLGVTHTAGRWCISGALFLLLLVGPFVDHIVGMRQFEKLCKEQTGLQIYSTALTAKRGRELPAQAEPLSGNAVRINRQVRNIINLDTGELIAQYNYFSTRGGRIGGLVMLGGEYTCAINQPRHAENQKFLDLKTQVNLTYGDSK